MLTYKNLVLAFSTTALLIACGEGFEAKSKQASLTPVRPQVVIEQGREADGEGDTPLSVDQQVLEIYRNEMSQQTLENVNALAAAVLGVSVEFSVNEDGAATSNDVTGTAKMITGEVGDCETLMSAQHFLTQRTQVSMQSILTQDRLSLGDDAPEPYEFIFHCTLNSGDRCDEGVLAVRSNALSTRATLLYGMVRNSVRDGDNIIHTYTNDRDVNLEGFVKAQSYERVNGIVNQCILELANQQAQGTGEVIAPVVNEGTGVLDPFGGVPVNETTTTEPEPVIEFIDSPNPFETTL